MILHLAGFSPTLLVLASKDTSAKTMFFLFFIADQRVFDIYPTLGLKKRGLVISAMQLEKHEAL